MRTPSTRRFVATLIAVFVLLALVVGDLQLTAARHEMRQQEVEARLRVENLARLVDQRIQSEVDRIDVSLREIAGQLEDAPSFGPAGRERQTARLIDRSQAILGRRIEISLLDAGGSPAGLERTGRVWTAPADGHRQTPDQRHAESRLIVTDPVTDPETGRRLFRLSLAYRAPDGRIAGFVAASVPVDNLSAMLAGLDLGPHGVALIRDSSGTLMTRQPSDDPGARRVGRLTGEGVARISADRQFSALPFRLVVGMAAQDRPAPWQKIVARDVAPGVGFLLVTLLSIAFMWSQFRRAEENRSLLRALMDSIPDLIWLKDPQGVYLACNPRFEQFFGRREADIVGQDDAHFVGPDLAEFFRNNDRLALEADGPRINEEWLTFADDGHHGLFETIKTPMKTDQGKLIGVLGIARDISRQREAIDALAIREELYSSIVTQAGDGIVLIDPETYQFIEFNDAACGQVGYGREEFAGLTLFDLQFDHGEQDVRRVMAGILDGAAGAFEVRHRHKDGTPRDTWVSNRSIQIRGRTLLTAIWHDLTRRKAAEAALRDERQFRETIMESIPGICYALDPGGDLLYWNQTLERVTERTPETLQGRHALDFFEGGDRERIRERIAEAFATGEAVEAEAMLIAGSGRRIPFLFNSRRIDMAGQTLLVGVGIDVSALKTAENALRRLNAELETRVEERTADVQAAHARLVDTQFAMDSVGIGIIWADFATARIVHVNRFAADFLGYGADELMALRVGDIDPNFPSDVYAHIARETQARGHIQFETEQLTKDGRRRPVEMTIYYHGGSEGAEPRLIGFMSDIAQRKEAELALRDAKETSEAANAAKSEFLANMSHEIRTPLNAILGLNYLLKQEDPAPGQLARLDKMEIAGRHLLSLINDILDLSKIEAGRMDLEHASFHLSTVLDNVASIIRDSAASKGLILEVDPDGVPLWLWGDVTRLRQALLNFAGNAVKFTERGTISLRSVLLADEGGELLVRFEVADTGIGLSPEQQERLFQSFEQADGSISRKFGGTGLGLALTKRLVELMGGRVGLDSTAGVGSTFWFSVPLQRGHGPTPIAPTVNRVAGAESRLRSRHRGARVLLAEDNAINVEVVLEMLHAVGIDVTVVENGRQAVDRAGHQTFDLILMDMQMPELDGIEATRLIRTLPQWTERPIIALTANAFAEDRQACLAAGMNDILTKPVEPALLYATLLRWLDPDTGAKRGSAEPRTRAQTQDEDERVFQALRTQSGIDVDAGLGMLRGNAVKYLALVRQLVDTQPVQMAEIDAVLDAGDRVAARRIAHSLKGSAATLGLTAISEGAARVEQMLKTEDDLASQRPAIQAGISEILAGLRHLESILAPGRQAR